ncbi:MAG: 2-oxoacid:acceptor oxidoreductase family protein [Alphaproteobacteria bacterium]
MYRIRFHGRGGQGTKTASRILGRAFFLAGFEVQDAPVYGAERRGAPMFAYVRAARAPINERGVIRRPDLVIVVDDTLVPVPSSGVLSGLSERSVMLIRSPETSAVWKERLKLSGPVICLPSTVEEGADLPYLGTVCAGAAARLLDVIDRQRLEEAIREELAPLGEAVVRRDLDMALSAFDAVAEHAGIVTEGTELSAEGYESPGWIDFPFEDARRAAPAIYGGPTSVEVRTGLWRSMRPVVETDLCNRCVWICATFCPDNAISVGAGGYPEIDYDHCKGCMICVAQCPTHAIHAIPETAAKAEEEKSRPAAGAKP